VKHSSIARAARELGKEWLLAVSLATCAFFAIWGTAVDALLARPAFLALVFAWLFGVVMVSALAVVRHADHVAEVLGEPYGTLVLTLAVTSIEVLSISAVMLHGDNNPTLVRDTLFSVVMILLGGVVGMALLLGGFRHREQHYNLQGANAYLGVIIPLAVLTLTLANFTTTTPGPTLSLPQQMFLLVVSCGLYVAFLAVQTGRHRAYFAGDAADIEPLREPRHVTVSLLWHTLLLLAYILPVVFLAEQLAHPIDYFIETLRAPATLGGLVIAMLVATPEAITAIRAATANRLQRSINVSLGSVLSTTGLTVPAMLVVSYLSGREIYFGLNGANNVILILTLAVSVVTFASGRTNVLQGAVHVILFASFVMLIVQG
jgi:Ca2+:H+ antiporter